MATTTALVAGVLSYVGAAAAALGVVASGGTLALALAAAAAGGAAGGGVGALISRALGAERARELETLMAVGGLVLWVRVRTPEQQEKAQRILREHGADAVRVHEIEIDKRLEDLPLASLRPRPVAQRRTACKAIGRSRDRSDLQKSRNQKSRNVDARQRGRQPPQHNRCHACNAAETIAVCSSEVTHVSSFIPGDFGSRFHAPCHARSMLVAF
ncbi:hypothetical protein [Azospirillum baldaniorum]|uniref:hypothetical protein n=1 Tax=Azospirillum baldaniorum TaxID=1064539 RepID=UPI00157A810B|nr:hypothetical protein [Azospirillum baldaniorum]